MSLPSAEHIELLFHIAYYCAALPVPGLEEGGVVGTMFLMLYGSKGLPYCCVAFNLRVSFFFHRLLLRLCVAVAPFKASAISK